MEKSVVRISKALLDLAAVSDAVLYATPMARTALTSAKLDSTQRNLLARIDGFRSLEQLLAISSDLVGVHAALGKLMAAGLVTTASKVDAEVAEPVNAERPEEEIKQPKRKAPPVQTEAPVGELDNAKQLLLFEVKLALGKGAEKLRPRIQACSSIGEIYDLIVKIQQHLKDTGKADPDVFLDRLTDDLAKARKKSSAARQTQPQ
jgi:hypothetical protein